MVEIYSSKISEIGKFNYLLELVQGETRLNLSAKPENSKGKLKNHHIRRLVFREEAPTAEKLPENLIHLGAADIQRIKSTEPGSNPDTDPGAKFTMLGCVTAERSDPSWRIQKERKVSS